MAQPKILNPDKGRFFKSVTFHAWISFLSLAVVIIAIMATVFLVVYTFMYRNQRINSVVGTGNYIMSTYPENATEENKARFVQVLDEIVVVNNISVVIFSKTNTDEELTLDNISVIVSRIREGEGNMADITNQAINDKYMSNIDK